MAISVTGSNTQLGLQGAGSLALSLCSYSHVRATFPCDLEELGDRKTLATKPSSIDTKRGFCGATALVATISGFSSEATTLWLVDFGFFFFSFCFSFEGKETLQARGQQEGGKAFNVTQCCKTSESATAAVVKGRDFIPKPDSDLDKSQPL
jgi:hypothetical protein